MVKEHGRELVSQFIDLLVEDADRARELLLEYPDLLNARCLHDDTILQYLTSEAQGDAVEFLLDRGAEVNVKNRFGFTPLMEAAKLGNHRIARILLENGADANAVSNDFETPLLGAVTAGSATLVDLLLQFGADPGYRSPSGKTIFDVLPRASKNRLAIFRILEKHHSSDASQRREAAARYPK
jgi:ankyrin repeat protein